MTFDFFPSRTLTVYLGRLFILRIAAVLVMLVLVLAMLDLLSNSGKILAVEANGQAELWHYVSLRIPQLAARFTPYSVLLATIITLVTLNQNSEVIAMKAAGLSAHQILAPLMLSALIVALANFAFNETIVTRANAELSAWEKNEYRPVPPDSALRFNVYLTDGEDILAARRASASKAGAIMEDVTWYDRSAEGMIEAMIRAPLARYRGPGWELEDAVRFDVATARSQELGTIVLGEGIIPEQILLQSVNADGETLWQLSRSIAALEAAGRRTSELRTKWWHKITGPLSSLLMPLLGSIAAFGLARSGQLFLRAIAGMGLGFAYFVVENAALAMGNFGAYPPLLAAWGPFLLFALVGETVLIATEE